MNAKFSVVIIQVKAVIYSESSLRVRLSTEDVKNVSWLSPLGAWVSMTMVYSLPFYLDLTQSLEP